MQDEFAELLETAIYKEIASQAFYEATKSFVLATDGVQRLSFDEDKRIAVDAYAVYEVRAEEEDIFRIQEEWYPAACSP